MVMVTKEENLAIRMAAKTLKPTAVGVNTILTVIILAYVYCSAYILHIIIHSCMGFCSLVLEYEGMDFVQVSK